MPMDILIENLIKIGIAVLVGGIIGAEREFRDKAAGFRTIILITVGSALFTFFRPAWILASPVRGSLQTSSRALVSWVRGRLCVSTGGSVAWPQRNDLAFCRTGNGHRGRRADLCRCFHVHR